MNDINKDIEILESECYYLEELGYLRENNHFIRFNQALENLIKGYRELEEENRIFALARSNIELKRYVEKNYIPKSKIKEKIEELEKEKDVTYTKFLAGDRKDEVLSTKGKMLEGAIQVLQELMEDK